MNEEEEEEYDDQEMSLNTKNAFNKAVKSNATSPYLLSIYDVKKEQSQFSLNTNTNRNNDYFNNEIQRMTESTDGNFTKITSLSKTTVHPNFKNLDNLWINHINFCVPRPSKELEEVVRVRTPWSYPISIWARQFNYLYDGESEEVINKAFEHDFKRANFHKDMKNDSENLALLKDYLKNYYFSM